MWQAARASGRRGWVTTALWSTVLVVLVVVQIGSCWSGAHGQDHVHGETAPSAGASEHAHAQHLTQLSSLLWQGGDRAVAGLSTLSLTPHGESASCDRGFSADGLVERRTQAGGLASLLAVLLFALCRGFLDVDVPTHGEGKPREGGKHVFAGPSLLIAMCVSRT